MAAVSFEKVEEGLTSKNKVYNSLSNRKIGDEDYDQQVAIIRKVFLMKKVLNLVCA